MQVSVKTVEGLERILTVSIPQKDVKAEFDNHVNKLVRTAKIPGFRPGKASRDHVLKRLKSQVHDDVGTALLQATIEDAFKKEDLVPASQPVVAKGPLQEDSNFEYTVTFEIYPTFEIKDLDKVTVEKIVATVTDHDLDEMLDKIAEQHKTWKEVTRDVSKNDKVLIDFEGFINNEPFEGGRAESFEIVVGSQNMIPGFEDGLIKAKKDKPFEITVTFPEDYGHAKLAGQEAVFKITVHQIFEGEKAPLDDALAEKLNIKEGGIDALKKDVKETMVRELENQVSKRNQQALFDKLVELNPFDVPTSLVDNEIGNLKHEMFHRLYGPTHSDNEKIPDFPRELFEQEARNRVVLGLLLSEYIKKHTLAADPARVDAKIATMASAYEKPEELLSYFKSKEHRGQIESMILEETAAEKIASHATIKEKKMTYTDIMNPNKEKEKKAKGKGA